MLKIILRKFRGLQMVSKDIIRRFVAQIKKEHSQINESTIEKDFYLTLLLNEISNDIEENKDSPFRKLVFKGGTLLARVHLDYHRISEDLDFTYLDNKKLNNISSKQRKKIISGFTNQLVEEIYKITKKFGLDFSTNKSDKKYCKVADRKNVYLFKVYYKPVYGAEESIKFEVNFNDELVYPASLMEIKHLFNPELIKDLEFIEGIKINIRKNILCYDLKEIAVEKIRAVLTRPVIKERDLFDLFLISEKIELKELKKNRLIEKVIRTTSFIKGLPQRIKKNLEVLIKREYGIVEEKNKLALIKIDKEKYSAFEKSIIPLIIEIGEKSLLKLNQSSTKPQEKLS